MKVNDTRRRWPYVHVPTMRTQTLARIQHEMLPAAWQPDSLGGPCAFSRSTRSSLLPCFDQVFRCEPELKCYTKEGVALYNYSKCYWVELWEAPSADFLLRLRSSYSEHPARLFDFHLFIYVRYQEKGGRKSMNLCLQIPLYLADADFPRVWHNTVCHGLHLRKGYNIVAENALRCSYRPEVNFFVPDETTEGVSPADTKPQSIMVYNRAHLGTLPLAERLLAGQWRKRAFDAERRKQYGHKH